MHLPPEALVHVPALADEIVESEEPFFRLSRDRLAYVQLDLEETAGVSG